LQDHAGTCKNKEYYISKLLFRTYLILVHHHHYIPNISLRYPMRSTSRLCTTPKPSEATVMQITMTPNFSFTGLLHRFSCLLVPRLTMKRAAGAYQSPLTNHVNDSTVTTHMPNMNFNACRSASERAALHTAHFQSVRPVSKPRDMICVPEPAAYRRKACTSAGCTFRI